MHKIVRRISRRTAIRGGFALPGLVTIGACGAPGPMRDVERHALLRLYSDARKEMAFQTDSATIARLCATRDVAAAKIMRPYWWAFEGWPAIPTEVKWTDTGNYVGYRVELAPNMSLQTRIRSDDGGGGGTLIAKDDPLAHAVQTLRDRMVRVSGVMGITDVRDGNDRALIDLLAESSKGQQTSLLVSFTRVEKAI